ncbi:ATP-dependent RNA helicase DeaD [Desulfosalsimonas propionicica]|uniref:ATP-dependent RNA helicase DeaD n=1 Tax=Desulfosalsimonas propionicica TaxID=332175 RepID=A0A7W0C8P7_9BACT|nr:DEAD/DEAH box helicase [Desulfosalsimonas propionicica]MBA2881109.1 ATP-dependent RNA helicase DeaD [Desulfosalsimonas propionicica]
MSKNNETVEPADFAELNLPAPLLRAVTDAGYEVPTPIQASTIPPMMAQKDVIGQAQTGTGKTAAFALPILSGIDLSSPRVQVLVLTPTRELAIQVSESFHQYAAHLKDFRVLPIYGGQDYGGQLRRLKQGVHVVVGTPGRVMDHMRRKSLKLDAITTLVLDEADEMLRMGFIDDVEWILDQTPSERQIALFSATMPSAIRKIAQKHMHSPEQITIKSRTMTVSATRQRYWIVGEKNKLDALTRILEAEALDGVIIFVRTRTATLELARRLEARGYLCAALNGEISQNMREQTINRLKAGKLDILVATDVAARGLDVERISHVINYDVPYDPEAYVHRIGRTGRAGRSGEAIVFVTPRERRMLRAIENVTRQKIELLELPTSEMINDQRIAKFKQSITDTLGTNDLSFFRDLVDQYRQEHDVPAADIAAALAKMVQGQTPLLLPKAPEPPKKPAFEKPAAKTRAVGPDKKPRAAAKDEKTERYRIEVGLRHGVKPGNIVGAIANETGLDAKSIGKIDIHDEFSLLDLPAQMPGDVFRHLQTVYVAGRPLKLSRDTGKPEQTKSRGEYKTTPTTPGVRRIPGGGKPKGKWADREKPGAGKPFGKKDDRKKGRAKDGKKKSYFGK